VVVFNNYKCTDTAFVEVTVLKKPVANAGPDKRVMPGQSTQLAGAASGSNITYQWFPPLYLSAPDSLQPIASPVDDMIYKLQVLSDCGTASDSVKVYVLKNIFVPNAFSPNGDGVNDVWEVGGINGYTDYEILVYNRYGQKVFASKNGSRLWDGTFRGTRQPTGVYTYIVSVKDVALRLSGWVLLVK
jgi:gliding motility-associated-like protein